MFKNKAVYVEMVEKRNAQSQSIIIPEHKKKEIEEIVKDIVSDNGPELVKGIVKVMAAYFALKTASIVIDNLTSPNREE